MGWKDAPEVKGGWEAAPEASTPGTVASLAAGAGKGFGQTVLGAQHYLGKGLQAVGVDAAGRWLVDDAAAGRKKLEAEIAPYKEANPISAEVGDVGGQIVATLPVGKALAAPLQYASKFVPALAPAAEVLATSGMSAGNLTGARALAARMAGGAAVGGTSAALSNPGEGTAGAVVGAAFPIVSKAAGKAGEAVGAAISPLFKSGQERIAGKTLREFAVDPAAASAALKAAQPVVPGSMPTAAMAAGDEGLAALSRTLQNVSKDAAAEMSIRQTAQNTARNALLDALAGNKGKIAAAEAARDAATEQLREQALAAAGKLDANAITSRIERMIADPNNAGATARAGLQRALGQVREIAGDSGVIDARALYEIRKDLGLAMQGKLQGEAGNLRYARGVLDRVQTLFDNAIEQSINRVPQSSSRAVAIPANAVGFPGASAGPGVARPSWMNYLSEYAKQSVPINQMERMADVLSRIQTGTVDANGNLILSAAKLNNILKTEGQDLLKELSPQQIDALRKVAADLNAQQLAATSGKAIGSNTVQNLASANTLRGLVGSRMAGATPVQDLFARPVNWLYKRADEGIIDKLGEAMLDPQAAARLMDQANKPSAIQLLFSRPDVQQIGYRSAPVLAAQ